MFALVFQRSYHDSTCRGRGFKIGNNKKERLPLVDGERNYWMNAVVALGVVVLSESKIGQEEQHIQDGTARLRRLTRRNPYRDGLHFW